MANVLLLGLRGAQFLLTLIIMALVGNMIAEAISGNPSIVNFTMFVAVFSMLTLIYSILISFKEEFTFNKLVPSIVDLLNAVFFFIAGVALAAELGVHSCNNAGYTNTNRVTNGSRNTGGRCREAQAVTTFCFFNWALYMFTLALSFTGGRANLRGSGLRPAMSQRV